MSCAEMEVSVVDQLSDLVEDQIRWEDLGPLVDILRQLKSAKDDEQIDENERERIYALKAKVERCAIKVAKEETDEAAKAWKCGNLKPSEMRWQQDCMRNYADQEFCTAKLRKALLANVRMLQAQLVEGSRQKVAEMLDCAEDALFCAEDLLTMDAVLSPNDTWRVSASIDRAKEVLRKIEKTPHLKHAGLPMAAKKRHVSAADLLDALNRRINDAEVALVPLMERTDEQLRQVDEQRRQEEKKRRQASAELLAEAARKQHELGIEQIVQSLERRNKQAGNAARQFIEHVKLGNAGGAYACLNEIRRLDGGIPVKLQELYRRLMQSK